MVLRVLALSLLVADVCFPLVRAQTVLKVGGAIQAEGFGANGKAAFELWKTWADSSKNKLGFAVEFYWFDYDEDVDAGEVAANLTDPDICDPVCVDIFICPYGSDESIEAIEGIPEDSRIPILVWGASADAIFTEVCNGRRCYGTMTAASTYFSGTLEDLAERMGADEMTVGMITSDDVFGRSLADGTTNFIEGTDDVITLAAAETMIDDNLTETLDLVDGVIDEAPDVICIGGHFWVEDTIMRIANSTYRPKAIIATNALEVADRYEDFGMEEYMECVMQPTQWGHSPDAHDDIIRWRHTSFTALMGDAASYHSASAAAAAIAVTHAIKSAKENNDGEIIHLSKNLRRVDITTFYGDIKFNRDGSLRTKPMYTQQMQGALKPIVLPSDDAQAEMRFPLGHCSSWAYVLKVGGVIQKSGVAKHAKGAFDFWKSWVESSVNLLPFVVEFYWIDFQEHTAQDAATGLTDDDICEPECVDVFVAPWGTDETLLVLDGIPENSKIPILVWGSDSDDVFEACDDGGKSCFGTLTTASQYFVSGLEAMTRCAGKCRVPIGIIANDEDQCQAIANGALDFIDDEENAVLTLNITINEGKLSVEDGILVDSVIATKPKILVIAGTSGGGTEDVVMRIANSGWRPYAIIASNAIDDDTRYKKFRMEPYMQCLLQPYQWAQTDLSEDNEDLQDDIIGWDPPTFVEGIGGIDFASDEVAAAGAACVALTTALVDSFDATQTIADLADYVRGVDITTFFGAIAFNDDGSSAKPMYVRQMQGSVGSEANAIVMPFADKEIDLKYPISRCPEWKLPEVFMMKRVSGVSSAEVSFLILAVGLSALFI